MNLGNSASAASKKLPPGGEGSFLKEARAILRPTQELTCLNTYTAYNYRK